MLIFVIRENEIFMSAILYIIRSWTVQETPPSLSLYDPRISNSRNSPNSLKYSNSGEQSRLVTNSCQSVNALVQHWTGFVEINLTDPTTHVLWGKWSVISLSTENTNELLWWPVTESNNLLAIPYVIIIHTQRISVNLYYLFFSRLRQRLSTVIVFSVFLMSAMIADINKTENTMIA